MEKESTIKAIIKKSFLYRLLIYYRISKAKRAVVARNKQLLKEWYENGQPAPPPHSYKISVIKEYAAKFKSEILIETGTYLGETIEACKRNFKKLISIELDQRLYESAVNKFKTEPNISIYQGDSGEVLENVLTNISQPCLFWLDGHYSEGFTAKGSLNTPIIKELKHIFDHPNKNHVILIDDARCFTGEDDYPDIATLKKIINDYDPGLQFSVENDIIRIHN